MKIECNGSAFIITFADLNEFVDFCIGLGFLVNGGALDV